MSTVVARPDPSHDCGVTLSGVWFDENYLAVHDVPGTVRACECGRTWVAFAPPRGFAVAIWRTEGRIARWLRTRKMSA